VRAEEEQFAYSSLSTAYIVIEYSWLTICPFKTIASISQFRAVGDFLSNAEDSLSMVFNERFCCILLRDDAENNTFIHELAILDIEIEGNHAVCLTHLLLRLLRSC
jgi:hypothetical protein